MGDSGSATVPVESGAPERVERLRFNPFSPAFQADPYPTFARLRRESPVHRAGGMWVLTRYADVLAVLRDTRMSSGLIPSMLEPSLIKLKGYSSDAVRNDPLARFGARSIVFTDPPEHTRLRRLANKAFTPQRFARTRPRIERTTEALLDALEDHTHADLVAQLAEPLPATVMSELLGVPEDLRAPIPGWTHELRILLEPALVSPAVFARTYETFLRFTELLRSVVRECVARPRDDLLSDLASARAADDRLSEDELVYLALMSFVAGNETTQALIANGTLALLRNRSALELLRGGDEALYESAVDELLRYETPLQMTVRRAGADLEVGDRKLPAGERLVLCLGAANRDPEAFPDPDRLDLQRRSNRHLALGFGLHHCLGGAIARVEAAVTLAALLRRFPALSLASDDISYQRGSTMLRSVARLPVRLHGNATPA